jgi:hypothetical protein
MCVLTNDKSLTRETIVDVVAETITNTRSEWVRLFGKSNDVDWALAKVLDELEIFKANNETNNQRVD